MGINRNQGQGPCAWVGVIPRETRPGWTRGDGIHGKFSLGIGKRWDTGMG